MSNVQTFFEHSDLEFEPFSQFSEPQEEEEDYDFEDYIVKMELILDFAKITPSFKPDFIQGVYEKYQDKEEIPESIRNSIDNIFEKFRVAERLKESKTKKKKRTPG